MYELYLVTDEKASLGRSIVDIVRQAVKGGVSIVQLREKELDTRQFIERARELQKILKPQNIPLIINDRIDIALAVNADGVHIGQKDMPFELVKRIIPGNMIVGLSVETIEQLREAESLPADYIAVSPVFSTPVKTDFDQKPWGLEGLAEARKLTKHTLVAIGGVNASNAMNVISAGADGIAVVSGICSADNPEAASRELINIVKNTKSGK
jgi:thiamine-phosphate pyrophosphorylase